MKLLEQYKVARSTHKILSATLPTRIKACTGVGLTMMEIHLLVSVYNLESDDKSTCSMVADDLGVTLPNVTGLYRRLERIGLAKKPKADDGDRRSRLLHTTVLGAEIAKIAEEL